MALTAGQLTQVQTYVAASQSLDAVEYLTGLGYSQEYAMRQVANAQGLNVGRRIRRGSIEERDAIPATELYEGRRFEVVPDGVNSDDSEGLEYIYLNGEWKNPAGFVE